MQQPPSQDPTNLNGPSSPYSQSAPLPPPPPPLPRGSYPPGEEEHYNRISQAGGPITQPAGPVTQRRAKAPDKLTPPSKPGNPWKVATLILFILVLILATATATLFLTRTSGSTTQIAPQPTSGAAPQPTSAPTQVAPPTTVPTNASTPSSTVTPQPAATLAAASTITENITLSCVGCNDPIRVKIDTIQIDTANGRMIWNLTLTDITGSNIGYQMNQFSVQANASQTQIPATFSQGQGSLVTNTPLDIQAIFAFVPYHNVTYTLTAVIYFGQGTTTFDPVKITF